MSQAIKYDGFEGAELGTAYVWDHEGYRHPCTIYSADKMMEILEKDMPAEDAHEFLLFNYDGAYLGENTPIIIWDDHDEDEE